MAQQSVGRCQNVLDDMESRLMDVTDGIYATTHMTRAAFDNPVEADGARSGIHYVALKLENEMRTLREDAAQSRAAWQREWAENWQWGPPEPDESPKPERKPLE